MCHSRWLFCLCCCTGRSCYVSCLLASNSACTMYTYIYDLCIKCHMSSSSDSLVIAIILKARKKFLVTVILSFCILQKKISQEKLHIFLECITIHYFRTLSITNVILTLQICTSAMLFLLNAGNLKSGGVV